MRIRPLHKNEIQEVARIIGSNYSKEWEQISARELESMFIESPFRPAYLVAEEEGQVVGVAGYVQSWMDYGIYQVFWVNVRQDRQRQGIGRQLVSKVISEIRRLPEAHLVELSATPENVDYYSVHFGFQPVVTIGATTSQLMCLSLARTGTATRRASRSLPRRDKRDGMNPSITSRQVPRRTSLP